MGSAGGSPSRLFLVLREDDEGEEKGRHKSSHTISKQVSFSSQNEALIPIHSGKVGMFIPGRQQSPNEASIPEVAAEDDVSENSDDIKSDSTSSEQTSSSDSIDAEFEKGEETAEQLYE